MAPPTLAKVLAQCPLALHGMSPGSVDGVEPVYQDCGATTRRQGVFASDLPQSLGAIDTRIGPHILTRVIRLLVSMLCALGLAFAPVAPNAAVSQTNGMLGCAMDGKRPAKAADYSKMDCCTPACQAPSTAPLLPSKDAAGQAQPVKLELPIWAPVKELSGVKSSGLDPPPRV